MSLFGHDMFLFGNGKLAESHLSKCLARPVCSTGPAAPSRFKNENLFHQNKFVHGNNSSLPKKTNFISKKKARGVCTFFFVVNNSCNSYHAPNIFHSNSCNCLDGEYIRALRRAGSKIIIFRIHDGYARNSIGTSKHCCAPPCFG